MWEEGVIRDRGLVCSVGGGVMREEGWSEGEEFSEGGGCNERGGME